MDEPDRNERRDNVQPDHVRLHMACGCSPHIGADLEQIEGCPIDFVNDLLQKQGEKERQLKAVLDLMTRIIAGEPLIKFKDVKEE